MSKKRAALSDLHEKWLKERPGYADAYAASAFEFEVIKALIEARMRAGLTQEQLAERLNTKQAAIARLESGRVNPSVRMIARIAEATGNALEIRLKPARSAA